ncbi:DNA integrity scanning protein DisA nucleotide-binding domain protein [Oscillatoria amoena NRMC-F 0135]|nr:DNA integrity scanning protein DisA nucleotide-binding domain protein [Oscillatoria amoena NRMC-F 0135]
MGLPLASVIALAIAIPFLIISLIQALPELKVILQRMSLQNVFQQGKSQTPELILDLAQSLIELKSRREGAIIVLAHHDSLEDLIVGGEPYDARFTRSLCVSLFNPESPRHDGAAILTGNRITHVGAVLPLSDRIQDHDEWGTRHLAALGLSERCDADILVVSEERGAITWFKEGLCQTLPSQSLEELRLSLTKIFISKESETSRRVSLLSPALWILAVIISAIGSYNIGTVSDRVFGKEEMIVSQQATVKILDIDDDLYVDHISSPTVEFMVRTPRNVMLPRNREWAIQIDGKNLADGSHEIEISPDMITGLPPKYRVFWFDPSKVTIRLAKVRTLNASIKPLVSGLNPNLEVSLMRAEPNRKKVKVMTASWRNNQTIDTVPIDLSLVDKPGDYIFESWINLPKAVVPEDKNDDYRVKVFINIVEKKNGKKPASR